MKHILNTRIAGRVIYTCLIFIIFSSCEQPCSELTEFRIYADEIGWDEKVACRMKIVHCDEQDSLDAEIKFRGGTSSRYDKHSYAVEFYDKRSFDGLDSAKDWILNASYIDKTFMRHKLCFDLFRQMDPDNVAPKCSYVNVYENDHYKGLYILMERMDQHRLQLDKDDKNAFIFKEPPLFYPVDPAENRDSLYLESQEYPKRKKGAFNDQLLALEKLIFEADDETFRKEIFNMLDIDNIVDWQLLLIFTNNSDGQLKNYYIYRKDSDTRMRIALWDYDHGLGRDGDNEYNMLKYTVDEKRNLLMKRLIELNPGNFNQKMAARWKKLRKTTFSAENINRMISENNQVIEPYIKGNAAVWPLNADWYFDDNNYSQEVRIIQQYVPKKLVQMDKRFGK